MRLIPARYCTGYLGDIGVPADPAPMDLARGIRCSRRPVVHLRCETQPSQDRTHCDCDRTRCGRRRDLDSFRACRVGALQRDHRRTKADRGASERPGDASRLAMATGQSSISRQSCCFQPNQAPFSTSITASAKACGASCGRLWPMPPVIVRCEYFPENFLA
jgi:hypothetical protein